MKVFKYKELKNYYSYIEEKSKANSCIESQTNRYNQILINFINGLLTYNCENRYSFIDIY